MSYFKVGGQWSTIVVKEEMWLEKTRIEADWQWLKHLVKSNHRKTTVELRAACSSGC